VLEEGKGRFSKWNQNFNSFLIKYDNYIYIVSSIILYEYNTVNLYFQNYKYLTVNKLVLKINNFFFFFKQYGNIQITFADIQHAIGYVT